MCQSKRFGGQRCYSGARKALGRALATGDRAAIQAAVTDLASTPKGCAALEGGAVQVAGADVKSALVNGAALRERNLRVRAAARAREKALVDDYVAQMQAAGYTRFWVYDNEEVTMDRVLVARDDAEMLAMIEHFQTKYAARVRRDDGTWPRKTRKLRISELPRTPHVLR
jgi:hypothetical protein